MEITNIKEVSVEEKEMMYSVTGYGALNRAYNTIDRVPQRITHKENETEGLDYWTERDMGEIRMVTHEFYESYYNPSSEIGEEDLVI